MRYPNGDCETPCKMARTEAIPRRGKRRSEEARSNLEQIRANTELTLNSNDFQQQISRQFPEALAPVENTGREITDAKRIPQHNVLQDHLSAVKSFRPLLRRTALHPAQTQHGLQRIFRKPVFNSLSLKDFQDVPNLLPAD